MAGRPFLSGKNRLSPQFTILPSALRLCFSLPSSFGIPCSIFFGSLYLAAMPLILNIDTAVASASICLADGDTVLKAMINPSEKESAAWLHPAIEALLREANVSLSNLNAVAVSAGPGSYTGLRVGMATAKGLCYALNVPLIAVSTLQTMAASAQALAASSQLLCPMIDARRMEVFTALYDAKLNEVLPATNLILDESAFGDWLQTYSILFFGNGSGKALSLTRHPHAFFANVQTNAANMACLSHKKFTAQQFAGLAYAEPFYGKAFHSPVAKKKY